MVNFWGVIYCVTKECIGKEKEEETAVFGVSKVVLVDLGVVD